MKNLELLRLLEGRRSPLTHKQEIADSRRFIREVERDIKDPDRRRREGSFYKPGL